MKKIILLLCCLLWIGQGSCFAGNVSIGIYGVDKKAIMDKVVSDMNMNNFMVSNANDYQITFRKDASDFGAQVFYGSQFNSTPEYRVVFNFAAQSNWVQIRVLNKMVTNPGSGYEQYSDVEGKTIVNYLNGLSLYFNGSLGTGISWSSKKADKNFKILAITQNSDAEKQGIQVGDIITSVNGIECEKIDIKKMSQLMDGDEGKKITLTLNRNGSYIPVTITYSFIPPLYNAAGYVRPQNSTK